MYQIKTKNKILSLDNPVVMGIINTTPDSFSDGGKYLQTNKAIEQALAMVEQGVKILDIGGESTRPGAPEVALKEELNRVIPVIEGIRKHTELMISIDTSKAEVMTQAVAAGADIINDVCALSLPGALQAAAIADVPVCLMHMQGTPRTMQLNPQYRDLITDIKTFFDERIDACQQAGINKDKLILDLGFGFGKTLQHNYQLMNQIKAFDDFGLPMLLGVSRKSMIGKLLDNEADQRLAGSLAAALYGLQQGAHIFRVHDTQATLDAIKVWQACRNPSLVTQ
ncbi:dihydropteroate synthase [Paraferrimonas sp. SM1919]|uniref:dihydropteroate synthase n=1 Tax=Paraferrimonas sp. SM1919 TaxID=2662263 RepID=UPI0013D73CF7|nr:dihydropteroate synthase [Paraferrimonas sp. SM1919]